MLGPGVGSIGRHALDSLDDDVGLGRHAPHLRQASLRRECLQPAVERHRVEGRQRPGLPAEPAGHRHDVGGRAALDLRHQRGGPWRVEAGVERPGFQLLLHAQDLADQAAGVGDGVDAVVRHARMRRAALELDAPAHRPLVGVDHGHLRRLPDEHHARPRQCLAELGDHRPHAGAADLLVVGEGEVEWHLELACLEARHQGEAAGKVTLHVASTAAEELAVALDELERIGVPILPGYRHHVGMTGEGKTATIHRSDAGEEARLEAVGRRHAPAGDAVPCEIGLHELDEGDVGLGAGRVEGDEPRQQLFRRVYAWVGELLCGERSGCGHSVPFPGWDCGRDLSAAASRGNRG